MKMRNLFLLSTIFLFFQNLYAFDHYKIKFVRYKLENGLTVILHKDTSKPIVSIGVIYHVGSKNEDQVLPIFLNILCLMVQRTLNVGNLIPLF